MKGKILIVEDDNNIADLIKLYITKEDYEGRVCGNGKIAVMEARNWEPDLILLDIMLPDLDGWEVCKQVRKFSQTPIIMLTARGEIFDKVLGLELGADDYIVKPFDPKELMARIKAVLRRMNKFDDKKDEIVYPELLIDRTKFVVIYRGKQYDLPPKELELFYFLASYPNIVFTREQLLEKVWDYEFIGDSRTVDVHIKRLREKFNNEDNKWELKTVWGVGYKFEVKHEKPAV